MTGESSFELFDNLYPFIAAISIGVDIDVTTGVGVDISPVSAALILKGNDKGNVAILSDFSDLFGSAGWDLAGSAEVIFWYYYGDINKFSAKSFEGERLEVEFGASYGPDFNVGLVVGRRDIYGGILIGAKASAGGGWSPFMFSGSSNIGRTFLQNTFKLW